MERVLRIEIIRLEILLWRIEIASEKCLWNWLWRVRRVSLHPILGSSPATAIFLLRFCLENLLWLRRVTNFGFFEFWIRIRKSSVVAVAADFEEKCKIVMSDLDDLEAKVHADETMCVKNQSTQIDLNALPNCADHEDVVISKENTKVLSPVAVRRKGRPSSKRKVSKVDEIVQRYKERKKKQHRAMPKAKMDSRKKRAKKGDHDEDMAASRRSMIATEENTNIIFGGSSVDVSSQRSVNLMENQGSLSSGGVMVPRFSLNQLQNSSQQSWTGGPAQLWRDYHDVNNPSFARNQYWNGGSTSGRVNMIDFMVNLSQTRSHHPT